MEPGACSPLVTSTACSRIPCYVGSFCVAGLITVGLLVCKGGLWRRWLQDSASCGDCGPPVATCTVGCMTHGEVGLVLAHWWAGLVPWS